MGKRLVRDRALESWVVPGAEHQVRPVQGRAEHMQLLMAKLLEEAGEVILYQTREELTKELADVLTVLFAVAEVAGIPWITVVQAYEDRKAASGGFTQGLVWETSR